MEIFQRKISRTRQQPQSQRGQSRQSVSVASKRRTKDPMRMLLAKYCGAHLKILRQVPGFLVVVEEIGEFARDLIMKAFPRQALGEEA